MTANPSDPNTATPLLVTKSHRALIQELEALKRHVETYASVPQAGCLFLLEKEEWKSTAHHSQRAHRRRLWLHGMHLSRLIFANMLDHLKATTQMLDADWVPLYSHQTLTRVVCEAAARIGYLLDRSASYDARLLHMAVPLLVDAEGRVTATREVIDARPDLPVTPDYATKQRDAVLRTIELAGIKIRRNNKNKVTHLELDPPTRAEPYNLNLTALVAKYFPQRPGSYRSTSGIVHSNPWMLGDTIRSSPFTPDLVLEPDLLGIGAAAMTVTDASLIVMESYARYYGHDPEPAMRASRLRQQAIDVFMQQWATEQVINR